MDTQRASGGQWITWGGIAAALVVGGVVGGALVAANRSSAQNPEPASASVCSATDVANKSLPSVVTITATKGDTGGTGSGEVIRSNGYILTNNHVVSIAADGGQVEVLFNDGHTTPATITGRDPKADLAVIKVDGQPSLPVIPFGSSKDVVVGQPVVALGAPLGLSNTVTSTDAAINPGNSGGALVNCNAQLIGVPSAGATVPNPGPGTSGGGSIGLGFAIPVDLAKSISDEIIATGTVTHAYFGLSVVTVPPAVASSSGHQGGVYVATVVPGSPAAQAGLKEGDVITAIDGKPATTTDDLAAVTLTRNPGDTVTVEYIRDGRPEQTKVTLGAQP